MRNPSTTTTPDLSEGFSDVMARTDHLPRHNGVVAPARQRKLRFAIALSCALLLASALIYTSFSASSEARSPSQLAAGAEPGRTYQLTGKVQPGSISGSGTTHPFRVIDRKGGGPIPPTHHGP